MFKKLFAFLAVAFVLTTQTMFADSDPSSLPVDPTQEMVASNLKTGVYQGPQSLELSTSDSTLEIYYSLSSTDSSDLLGIHQYVKPIKVSANANQPGKSVVLKAFTVKNGKRSNVREERLVFVSSAFSQLSYDVGSSVMLQAFTWTSMDPIARDWYKNLTNKADDIKSKFAFVWFPPSTDSLDGKGYLPIELNNLDTPYGTAAELKAAIKALSPAAAIGDIVVNHRAGTKSWGTFTNPDFGDRLGSFRSIVSNDEGFEAAGSVGDLMHGASLDKRGFPDSGENYEVARDIDHTNPDVQKDIAQWLNKLKNDYGFQGWRWDMVKGYGGDYVGYYDTLTRPRLSVGEYFSGNPYDVKKWLEKTSRGGYQSMAFHFPLKFKLNDALNGKLLNLGTLTKDAGVLRDDLMVTFVGNHDTELPQAMAPTKAERVYLGYAYILTHPGLPTVFYDHYFNSSAYADDFGYSAAAKANVSTLREHIDTLIALRKAAGVTSSSPVTVVTAKANEYGAYVGDKLAVRLGTGNSFNPGSGWGIAYFGTSFVIWQKGLVNAGTAATSFKVVSSTGSTAIDTENGRLQFVANTFVPASASQTIVWSVRELTGRAEITPAGELKALGNGTVVVVATALIGGAVVETPVTISGNANFYNVTFTLNDKTKSLENVVFKGAVDGWQLHPMTSQGNGVWTYTAENLTTGAYSWGMEAKNNQWVPGSEQPKVTIAADGTVSGNSFVINVVPRANVKFTYKDFSASQYGVQIKGTMTGWNPVAMYDNGTNGDDVAGDHIWNVVLNNVGSGEWGLINYNGDWLISGPNLKYEVLESGAVTGQTTYVYAVANVLFTLTDGTLTRTNVKFKGSATGWNTVAMHDDGLNGDVVAGDHVWSLLLNNISSGQWGAIEDDGSQWGIWLINGPNPSYTIDDNGQVQGQTNYTINAITSAPVTFTVTDPVGKAAGFSFKGSATNWELRTMNDSGINGDAVAGDHVWSFRVANAASGNWGFVDLKGTWLVQGPNPQYQIQPNGAVTGQTNYTLPLGAPIVFTVTDETGKYSGLKFKGDTTGWNTIAMNDSGVDGDALAGDHVWSVTVPFATSGSWGFVDGGNNWLVVGSNPSYTIGADGSVTGSTSYTIKATASATITFRVTDVNGLHPNGLKFKGNATYWNEILMVSEGSNVWAITLADVTSGEWGVVDAVTGSWLIDGPNPAYTVSLDGSVSGTTTYTVTR